MPKESYQEREDGEGRTEQDMACNGAGIMHCWCELELVVALGSVHLCIEKKPVWFGQQSQQPGVMGSRWPTQRLCLMMENSWLVVTI